MWIRQWLVVGIGLLTLWSAPHGHRSQSPGHLRMTTVVRPQAAREPLVDPEPWETPARAASQTQRSEAAGGGAISVNWGPPRFVRALWTILCQ
jgi:hypothetical protein